MIGRYHLKRFYSYNEVEDIMYKIVKGLQELFEKNGVPVKFEVKHLIDTVGIEYGFKFNDKIVGRIFDLSLKGVLW